MSNITPYIIWTNCRQRKAVILVDDNEADPYASLILKASQKFGIMGYSLALEGNGTPVEAEVLPFLKNEVLVVLEKDEVWSPRESTASRSISVASASTDVTGFSSDSIFQTASIIESPIVLSPTENDILVIGPKHTITIDCNYENLWRNFEIPWQKLTQEQLSFLTKGVVDHHLTTTLVQLIVAEMRCLKKSIPSRAFRTVAKKIIDAYPEAFLDRDRDGVVLGDGTHKLVNKLIDHNNYLNRPKGQSQKRKTADDNPVLNKKQNVSAMAGCSNWNPQVICEEGLSQTEKKTRESDENFLQILEKSYPEVRAYLNQTPPPSVNNIQEEWPILFSQKSIKWHFSKLTNSNIDLLDKLEEDRELIYKLCQGKMKDGNNENHDNDQDNTSAPLAVLRKIANYFKEDIAELIYTDKINENSNIPVTPLIVFEEFDNLSDQERSSNYFVYFERRNIDITGFDSFKSALKIAFSLFFIFNLKYPPKLCSTLEFLQRFYLKIHPDAGSKCVTKKVSSSRKKVMNFMLKFNKYLTI